MMSAVFPLLIAPPWRSPTSCSPGAALYARTT
jgi:hypothetical protein